MKQLVLLSSVRGALALRGSAMIAALALAQSTWAAGPPELLSARDPSVGQPAAANGSSVAPILSPDGRFVVFSSSASDLVTNDNGYLGLDVFLRDRSSNTTVLVSANLSSSGGGNGQSEYGLASTNGRYVMFESLASDLVAGDTNGVSDIFVRDVVTATTLLVSASTNGNPGNGVSSDATMTPDGRYVVFLSAANNLVPDDTNGITDVFVRDLVLQTTTLASAGATNPASATTVLSPPVITPDGHYVVFSSNAGGLSPDVPANPAGEAYVRDLLGGSTIWASTNAAAIVTVSDDGRFVTLKTTGTSWGGATLILQFDMVAQTNRLISTNGVLPFNSQNDDVYGPDASPDGRFVTYAATPIGTNTVVVQQWDANTVTNVLVSADVNGNVPTNSVSHSAKASPDGRFVAFLSNATNLVANTVSSGFHVYLRDLQAGVTRLVDANTNGVGVTDNWGTIPALSTNGQFVAFCSLDGSLVASDRNSTHDVFVRNTIAGTMELVSQQNPLIPPQTGNALSSSGPFSISADGRWVAFTTFACDLVTNDFNNERDVFVHDQVTGSNILVSVGLDGNAGLGGNSVSPAISADGRYVVFASLATNLVPNDTNGAADIFRRDLQTQTTTLVSVDPSGGSLGTNDASAPVISADGRYVAFLMYTNDIASMRGTFWRDIAGGITTMLTGASSSAPSISADGQRVAYFNSSRYLLVWDAQLAANISTNSTAMTAAAISPDGTRVLYQTAAGQLYVRDLAARTNLFIAPTALGIRSSAQWTSDGRYFAFVIITNLVAGDFNGTNDVYLCDVQTGTVTLISANSSGTASANGPSDWPVMSGDGRFVVYRSFATDVATGVLIPPSLISFDRLIGRASLLTTGTPGSGWSSWVAQPATSSNAAVVAFTSCDSGLVGGDLNRASDAFAGAVTAPPGTDSDGDGIPDWWMQQYFGHPTGLAGDQSRSNDDADGDGASNLQEYLAGTVPTAPTSVLQVTISPSAAANGSALLTWPAVAGRGYRVQYKDNVSDPTWQDAAGGVTVLGNTGRWTLPAISSGRYYRVVLVN
jgi:Tol biopolymer transport system component